MVRCDKPRQPLVALPPGLHSVAMRLGPNYFGSSNSWDRVRTSGLKPGKVPECPLFSHNVCITRETLRFVSRDVSITPKANRLFLFPNPIPKPAESTTRATARLLSLLLPPPIHVPHQRSSLARAMPAPH